MGCFSSLSALGAVLTLAGAGDDHLTIGSELPFPPYLMATADGGLEGFDHSLMTEICQRAHFDCKWQLATFDELIPGVMDGRFDVVLGGMGITPDRRAKVDFTEPYHYADDTEWFIGLPGAPAPEEAISAVQAGTIHEGWLRQNGNDFRAYATEAQVLQAVITGTTDLAFGPFENRADLEPQFAAAGLEQLYSVELPDEGTAMAVCKGNTALLTRLNDAITDMRDDGTLDELESRWF